MAEARGRVVLWRAAGAAVGVDAQGRAAGGAERAAGRVGCAARAATSGHRGDVAAGLPRDMRFDDLPSVFGQFVLPVRAERGEGKQHPCREENGDRRDRRFVEPLLHPDLDARAAVFRRDLDREGGGEAGQIAQRA